MIWKILRKTMYFLHYSYLLQSWLVYPAIIIYALKKLKLLMPIFYVYSGYVVGGVLGIHEHDGQLIGSTITATLGAIYGFIIYMRPIRYQQNRRVKYEMLPVQQTLIAQKSKGSHNWSGGTGSKRIDY